MDVSALELLLAVLVGWLNSGPVAWTTGKEAGHEDAWIYGGAFAF